MARFLAVHVTWTRGFIQPFRLNALRLWDTLYVLVINSPRLDICIQYKYTTTLKVKNVVIMSKHKLTDE